MGGYKNGKVEIFYGDNPPSNLNILWQKRIVTNGVESSELMQYNNNLATWESLKNKTIQDQIDAMNNLNGTNYVMVYGTGTPEENAAELQAAYNEAKKMIRFIGIKSSTTPIQMYAGQIYGIFVGSYIYYKILVDGIYNPLNPGSNYVRVTESEAKSTRTTVIVAPGEYNFGASAFVVDAPGIDIVSLTGNSDVIISSTEEDFGMGFIYGIKVTADNILIKGINCKENTFYVEGSLNNLICEYCIGGIYSFGGSGGIVSGTFNYCVGGEASFGSSGVASGIFNNCTGGDTSFGSTGVVSGTFNNCTGGNSSFGSYDGIIETSARLYYARLTSGTFPTPVEGGRLILCIDGNDNIVTI